MADHAKLSPSSAERWMTCPGSVVLSQGMEEKSSEYADEGTLAHAVAESLLEGQDFAGQVLPEGMLGHVRVYADHVRELVHEGTKLHVEVQVKVSDEVWGTADAIVWDPKLETLYVRDLKYGAGVPVEARGNLQLKIYATAALLTMRYPAKLVNVGIVQPRIDHPDGCVRSVDYDSVDLLDFWADLQDAIRDVELAQQAPPDHFEDFIIPSEKGCRWCLAAPKCPKLKAKAQEMAKKVFAPDLPYDPKELAEVLDFLPILEGWIKNTREFAYGEAEKGNAIPSYKLVAKQANRKWKPDAAADLECVLGDAIWGERPMKTVTEVQKICPGKNDKERAAWLEPYVTKESSGHTLVHESDKRPAVRVDAKAAFGSADAEP